MSESNESPAGEVIKGSVEIFKTVYSDALRPVSQQVGRALETLGGTVNVALSPLRGLVWSWEQIEVFVKESVERKLEQRKVPPSRITTPDPDVAVPAIEALRYTRLKDNYANLLATAMDSSTAAEAHPAFVEILKQLSPDEVKILNKLPVLGRYEPIADLSFRTPERGDFIICRHLTLLGEDAECHHLAMVPQYVDNLCRLGLTEIPPLRCLAEAFRYDRIRASPRYLEGKAQLPEGTTILEELLMIGFTPLGDSFRRACS